MNNTSYNLLVKTLNHMIHMSDGARRGSILLTGESGIGKTTFIKLLSKMTGLPAIVIEIPHITEEHIINIPFVVLTDDKQQNFSAKVENTDRYKVTLANSNLYTHVTHSVPLTDQQYIESMKNARSLEQQFYKQMGGTDKVIPPLIKQVRDYHNVILFLDEFLRETSTRIQNILRDILDGRIGLHDIPRSTYVIYATNKADTGIVSDIPINRQFKEVEYPAPKKNEWFQWFESKYKNHPELKINNEVIQHFKKILKNEHISFTDAENDVRTSPRRWEQLLLYIGTGLPAKNMQDAKSLLSNVKHNFVNYETGNHSKLTDKVLNAVVELIKTTSNLELDPKNDTNSHSDWRITLDHQIQTAMKLGEHRTHVPIVNGPPGIGKTAHIAVVARDNGMLPVVIRCGNLNTDDIVGIPLPGGRDTESMSVKFSLPKLHELITREIKKTEAAYFDMLKKQDSKSASVKMNEFHNQKWKYLIFFDEINNVSEQTFNALRRVMLERNFGPKDDGTNETLDLPKGSIVIGAMNPTGSHTTQLTKHFRDVIDPIEAAPSWKHTEQYLTKKNIPNINKETKDTLISLIQQFVHRFGDPELLDKHDQKPFSLHLGTSLYISPREYEDMLSDLALEIHPVLEQIKHGAENTTDLLDELKHHIAHGFQESLNFIFTKHGIPDSSEQKDIIKSWVFSLDNGSFAGIISKAIDTHSTHAATSNLNKYLEGKDLIKLPDDVHFININNAARNDMEIVEVMSNTISDGLKQKNGLQKFLLDESHPLIEINEDNTELTFSKTKKASLIKNFCLAGLYALHILEFSPERLQHIARILTGVVLKHTTNVDMPDSTNVNQIKATGTTQKNANPLSVGHNELTNESVKDGSVILPTPDPSSTDKIIVINKSEHPLNIYPNIGGSIDELGKNKPFSLPSKRETTFVAVSATKYEEKGIIGIAEHNEDMLQASVVATSLNSFFRQKLKEL